MVVQSLQHNIHGECEQAGQEDVENKIEEEDKTCGQMERTVVSVVCNILKIYRFLITLCNNNTLKTALI